MLSIGDEIDNRSVVKKVCFVQIAIVKVIEMYVFNFNSMINISIYYLIYYFIIIIINFSININLL